MTDAHPFNPAKLLWHRDKIALMFAGQPTPAPISLEWDLSNTCSHACPFCSFGTPESQGYRFQHWQHFPTERAFDLIVEFAQAGVTSITFTGGGEPLMHPKAADLMAETSAHGMKWGLVTNGGLLTGAKRAAVAALARFVRVSLDAGTPESHAKMHRPNSGKPEFAMILDHIAAVIHEAALAQREVPLAVGASFCVTDVNYQEIGTAAAVLKRLGAAYLEVRPTYPTTWRGDGWDFALTNVEAARANILSARDQYNDDQFQIIGMVDRFDALAQTDKPFKTCQIGPLMTVLGADGRLWHCCVQRGQEGFDLGTVLDKPFAEAWALAQRRKMAEWVNVKKCPRCRYQRYLTLLEGMQADALHVDFV
jgi:radical SAM protein with 4Fe4S-binding SPASM domain